MGFLHITLDLNAFKTPPTAESITFALGNALSDNSVGNKVISHGGVAVGKMVLGGDEHLLSRILVMTPMPGYWGRGKTLGEAVEAAQWIGCGHEVSVFLCDEHARVNEVGAIAHRALRYIGTGKVKRRKGKWFVAMEFTGEKQSC